MVSSRLNIIIIINITIIIVCWYYQQNEVWTLSDQKFLS